MAQSNSKIGVLNKQYLAEMKMEYPNVQLGNNEKTTVAFIEGYSTVEFSTAVASKSEKKFRRKVGEFHAFNRLLNKEAVIMDKFDFYDMMENMGMSYPM